MAAVLKKELGINLELIKGKGGIFDVSHNGELVYSKLATGSFPEESHVVELLKARAAL